MKSNPAEKWHQNARPTLRHAQQSIEALVNAVMYTYEAEVAGDVAEFGVATGSTATALASAMSACHEFSLRPTVKEKRLHIFDSFKGLPEEEQDTQAPHIRSGAWRAGKCNAHKSTDEIRKKICDPETTGFPSELLLIYEGWFSHTVSTFLDPVALVHVDCDLYSSTVDCLAPLFSRGQIQEGCVLMFDDWDCNRASPLHGERRAWGELCGKFKIQFSDGGNYGIFGHKFIVHRFG